MKKLVRVQVQTSRCKCPIDDSPNTWQQTKCQELSRYTTKNFPANYFQREIFQSTVYSQDVCFLWVPIIPIILQWWLKIYCHQNFGPKIFDQLHQNFMVFPGKLIEVQAEITTLCQKDLALCVPCYRACMEDLQAYTNVQFRYAIILYHLLFATPAAYSAQLTTVRVLTIKYLVSRQVTRLQNNFSYGLNRSRKCCTCKLHS